MSPELRGNGRLNSHGDYFQKQWQPMLTAAKIKGMGSNLCFHSFRHWVGTELSRAGYNTAVIAAVMGHEGRTMTERRYIKAETVETLKRVVDSLPTVTVSVEAKPVMLLRRPHSRLADARQTNATGLER